MSRHVVAENKTISSTVGSEDLAFKFRADQKVYRFKPCISDQSISFAIIVSNLNLQ
jgi:hypothetical protein